MMVFRALVGAASVAVIAAVGYYFTQEYQVYTVAAAEDDYQRHCDRLLTVAYIRHWDEKETRVIGECLVDGRINQRQINESIAAMPDTGFTFEHLGDPSTQPDPR